MRQGEPVMEVKTSGKMRVDCCWDGLVCESTPGNSKIALMKGVKRIYWPVQFDDHTLNDIFVHRNHSSHSEIWNPDFELPNEQTTAWLASVRLCDRLLAKNKGKFDELVRERFDTIVVDDLYNPCGLLQVALKGSVYIYWSMTSLRTESAWANQSPSPPSYLPVPGTKYVQQALIGPMLTDDLTFMERTFNLISYLRALYIHHHVVLPRIDAVFQVISWPWPRLTSHTSATRRLRLLPFCIK
ncbi:hypothetical protein ANCDUO_08036 [Ancylostoma duodenale]|uniref:Uncharacterized protein n=1 Tax=Ancylostoma duodenale TaxID=51022 RepID=A0A0C2DGW1_9BILA|nr:hypothetical protein ANCDUO_08036 [Ancylostoma duodenale]